MAPIVIVTYLNFAGALLAFFLAARAVTLDRRALRTHRASWIVLSLTTALYAALLGVVLVTGAGEAASAAGWLETLLESAISAALIAGCFFLYVREHKRVAALYEAAESESRRSRRLEAIVNLGNELRAASSADEVARLAANAVERTLAFRENALYLLDEEDGVFYTAASSGAYPDYDAQVRDKRIPPRIVQGLLRPEFRRGLCYFIDHRVYAMSDEETFFFPNGPVPDRGEGYFHADDALFAPLYDHDDELIGLFDVYDPSDGRLPGDDTFQLLEVFATVTASALVNARYDTELRQLAVSDGLTGLFNHRHFQETLVVEVERAQRYELVFTLLMMDLDLFKNVNDRLGHPRGDEALKAVAGVLRANARAADFVARYGGEEFVMILPGTAVKQAASLAERIAQGVREVTLDVPDPPKLSISIGMADFPACGRDRESLIAAADAALLFAKRSGRDMVADFSQISLVELDTAGLEGLAFRLEKADIETVETLAAAIEMRDAFAAERPRTSPTRRRTWRTPSVWTPTRRPCCAWPRWCTTSARSASPWRCSTVAARSPTRRCGPCGSIRRSGKRLLESTMRLNALLPVVLHHHERWDGSGYPDGLRGEQIPFAARVISLCDTWQAMVTDRAYRPALGYDEAVAELRRGSGTQFDPDLVEVFIASLQTAGGAAG